MDFHKLADDSASLWAATVDGCVDPDGNELPEKQARAMHDATEAELAWETAIDNIEIGDFHEARAALLRAAALASNWGDDAIEQRALAALA